MSWLNLSILLSCQKKKAYDFDMAIPFDIAIISRPAAQQAVCMYFTGSVVLL